MEEVRLSSNWSVAGGDRLINLVTYCSPENIDCGIENVTVETCICLVKEEKENSHSKPELEVKCQYNMTEMNIFSEGSLIEVFGLHDEYLFTCSALFIDDWEGMSVYQARITLPSVKQCKLKFTRIREKSRLWLYNIQLLVTKVEEPFTSQLFNVDSINKLIKNESTSEKREKFQKIVELLANHSQNKVKSDNWSVQLLLHSLNSTCSSQVSKSSSHCITDSNFLKMGSLPFKTVPVSDSELPLDCDWKSYIDKRISEMKKDILTFLEVKLEALRYENNTKLDKILRLLEASKI